MGITFPAEWNWAEFDAIFDLLLQNELVQVGTLSVIALGLLPLAAQSIKRALLRG